LGSVWGRFFRPQNPQLLAAPPLPLNPRDFFHFFTLRNTRESLLNPWGQPLRISHS